MQVKNKKSSRNTAETIKNPEASETPGTTTSSEAPTLNLQDVLNTVVSEVAPPSPVADMPAAPSQQPQAASSAPPSPAAPGKRGRPALTPEQKAQRKAERANGAFVKKETDRPTLNGIPHITPSPLAGQEGIEPCAQIATSMVAFSGMALGGEAAVMMANEQILIKDGFVAYFKAKGINNVPAWVVLAGALAPYYMRVFTTTPAKTKAALFVEKATFGVKHLFGKMRNARANRRNDTKRENNGSEENSANVKK